MSEKYIDLADTIIEEEDFDYGFMVKATLSALDKFAANYPDQVPGRTITRHDVERAFHFHFDDEDIDRHERFLAHLGIAVVPDPEPTIPVPTEPGARFIAYSPKWSDGPQDQREFVVAGTSIVDIDTGNTCHRAAFADYWTVTALVKAPGGDDA